MKSNNQLNQEVHHKIHKIEVILLVVVFIVIAVVAAVFYGKNRDQGDQVIVKMDNQVYGTYPLSKDQEITIDVGDGQYNLLIIKDGFADVIDASCPDHLCVNMKSISLEGESIVCLPNKVIVEIDSDEAQSDIDVMAQ